MNGRWALFFLINKPGPITRSLQKSTYKSMASQPVIIKQEKKPQILLLKATKSQCWQNKKRNSLLCNWKLLIKTIMNGKRDN